MKSVKLNYDEYVISDEVFEQIAAIVKAHRLCELCGNPYTPDNPNVELNRCLKCFLRYHDNQGLTYIKLYEVNQHGDEIHWFLDPLNIVSYTKTSSKEPQKSNHYTLLYWGFPVPQTWQDNEQTKQVIHYHWSIYGDVKHGGCSDWRGNVLVQTITIAVTRMSSEMLSRLLHWKSIRRPLNRERSISNGNT